MRPLKHGTRHGYAHHGCRCEPCVDANAVYSAELRAAMQATAYCPICCDWVRGIVRHEAAEHGRVSA